MIQVKSIDMNKVFSLLSCMAMSAVAALSAGSCKSQADAGLSAVRDGGVYDSYRGLVMAGYQGWFNAEGDGCNRGFYHYTGRNGFKPGSATIDMWPDVSEYEKTYPTAFTMPDGSAARVFSSEDKSTVDTHFRWMKEYGLDGVFMQRFVGEIKGASGKRHFNNVLDYAMDASDKYQRAIAVMYDLSGMREGDSSVLLSDIDELATRHKFFDRNVHPCYLYHNGRPMVAVWGIGFNDNRRYGMDDARKIIKGLKDRGYSIMIGVPTNWRELKGDTVDDTELHALVEECDVVMPWFVGRYNETTYDRYKPLIAKDLRWCKDRNLGYAPLVFPGFAWRNMNGPNSSFIPRNNGSFFKMQIDEVLNQGAEMIYVAMFDEIDEGTAIFKCAKEVPVAENGTEFVAIDEAIDNDYYLKTAGEASRRLKANLGIADAR